MGGQGSGMDADQRPEEGRSADDVGGELGDPKDDAASDSLIYECVDEEG